MGVMMKEELKRKAVHIGMGFWMFYPLFLTRIPALFVVLVMLVLALFVFRPHAWKKSFDVMARSEDYEYSYLIGPLIYICAIGICVVSYPLFISAASIGVMAFGDGFATLVGKRWGRIRNPIDKNKTVEGSVAFVVFSFMAITFTMHFTAPFNSIMSLIAITSTGAIVGAIVEMFPFEDHRGKSILQRIIVDDNFFVPILSGLAMFSVYFFTVL
ncbi:MAG: diacylglycerol/polyprenol kinase family protein [Candidatus Methanofastidiosia archaeon]